MVRRNHAGEPPQRSRVASGDKEAPLDGERPTDLTARRRRVSLRATSPPPEPSISSLASLVRRAKLSILSIGSER
jgi:hypothetical protein